MKEKKKEAYFFNNRLVIKAKNISRWIVSGNRSRGSKIEKVRSLHLFLLMLVVVILAVYLHIIVNN